MSGGRFSGTEGAIAQLGERLPCTQEVGSSILPGSTIHTGKLEIRVDEQKSIPISSFTSGTMFSGWLFNNSGYIKVRRETKPRSDFGTTFFGAGIFVSEGFSPVLFQESFIKRK